MADKTFSQNAVFGGAFAAGLLAGSLAMVAFHLARKDLRDFPDEGYQLLKRVSEELETQFHISSLKLQQLFQGIHSEMVKGLSSSESSLRMLPSFVENLPTGMEKGTFLAFDLGSSSFRVMRIFLEGQGTFRVQQKMFLIENSLKSQPADHLFAFMADSVAQFFAEHSIDHTQSFDAGMAFSFPVAHKSLGSASLIEWTKGYALTEAIGKDIVKLLNQALKKKGLQIHVRSLVNDAVGALVSRHYADPQCCMSIILGSGTNAAYIEKLSEIKKLRPSKAHSGQMVVSLEWGDFDPEREHLPITCYDLQLDRESSNPGKQIFEKMISGLYLGELVRLVSIDLIEKKKLFGGESSEAFQTPYSLTTAHLCRIERDHSSVLHDTGNVITEIMGISDPDFPSRQIFKRICEVIGMRAARLLASGVASVVAKMEKLGGCTVAIEGSLFRDYPHLKSRVMDALTEILGTRAEHLVMEYTPEGSGVGAALTAALSLQNPPKGASLGILQEE